MIWPHETVTNVIVDVQVTANVAELDWPMSGPVRVRPPQA